MGRLNGHSMRKGEKKERTDMGVVYKGGKNRRKGSNDRGR